MIIGASIGYIAQCRDIQQLKSSKGFSSLVTAILLFSNTLRCYFWVGNRFATALLIQAVVMLAVQVVLLHLAVKYREHIVTDEKPPLWTLPVRKMRNFWNWENLWEYLAVYIAFTLFFGLITLVVFAFSGTSGTIGYYYSESLGVASLLLEATIAFPQIWKNFRNKSTKGLSYLMIAAWVFGDTYKIIYFTISQAPMQFLACAAIQLTADFTVMVQIWLFRPASVKRSPGLVSMAIGAVLKTGQVVSRSRVSRFLVERFLTAVNVDVEVGPSRIMFEDEVEWTGLSADRSFEGFESVVRL